MAEATSLPPADVILRGHFEPDQVKRYVELPFGVPAGVRQMHVRYEYSDRIPSDPTLFGGNTLDIGLFDEQGTAAGGPGFRGWSGSNKLAFTLAEEWATPPYRPGPIKAGTWHVLLGPYKIGPRGLDYTVEVWFNPGLPPVEEAPALQPVAPLPLPRAAEPNWYRGDLHSHTVRSDGDSWPVEMLAAASAAGLEFVGITDHNSARPLRAEDLPGPPVLVPGVEVTTYGGHWNVWGVDGWFEFRVPTLEATAEAMRAARDAGGFVSVNHPKPFGPPWEYGDVGANHAVEIWNGPWERLNTVSLAYWDDRLRRGERLVAVGGSDCHYLHRAATGPLALPRIGTPTTWVQVPGELTADAILDALRAGRCFVSATPAGPQLYLTPGPAGLRVRVVGAPGAALMLITDGACAATSPIAEPDWEEPFPYPPDAAYVRAQVVDTTGTILAVSNPVWREDVQV